MAAGLGFKTFTTGEVLTAADTNGYLMQGINVFASSAARAAAITSPQEGQYSFLKDTNALEYYDGAAWVGAPVGDITAVTAGKGLTGGGSSGDVTVSLGTTAKGDLVVGTGASTAGVLSVSSDGSTLVADSSTSTGLRYQGSMAAGKNAIINGNFDIWQRGTSFASTTGYFADRWTNLGDFSSVTGSQQTTGAPDGSRYILRLTSTAASSYWSSYQFMETSTASTLWGKTVVFSAKLRRNATMTSGVNIFVQKSATSDAGSGASWTTVGTLAVANASMPTGTTSADWYFASSSITIPNDGTANSLRLVINYITAAASGSVLEISQVQLELGSVATSFTRAGGTIQGELSACQRYYYVLADGNTQSFGTCAYYSATDILGSVFYPVTMRTAPTFAAAAGAYYEVVRNGAADGLTGLQGNYLTTRTANIFADTGNGASGTAGNGGQYRTTSASANIAFSAEL